MNTLLAKKFKNRRLTLNMSQYELAKGICTQARISKIEKGNYSPGAELLYKLSQKMGVCVEYFFDSTIEETTGLGEFREISRKLIDHREYDYLKYIYDLEVNNNIKLSLNDELYLSWVESIILFFKENKKEQAINNIIFIINNINESEELYLPAFNTLLVFLFESNNIEEYRLKYIELNNKLKNMNIKNIDSIQVIIRLKYNYCRFLWLSKDIDKAIEEIVTTIEFCKKNKISYLLADLYCLLGNSTEDFKPKEEVKKYYEKALFLFREDNNYNLELQIEKYIKDNF